MGTRTAIFQEKSNGTFMGIYVSLDGYIEGVGKTLLEHYQDRAKIWELIKARKPLSSLGTTTEKLSHEQYSKVLKKSYEEADKYCVKGSLPFNDQEYFIALSVEEIQNEQYLTYDQGQIQGITIDDLDNKEFIPLKGSDHNGFLYYQDLNGRWYVSQMIANGTYHYKMGVFEPLDTLL